jgi:transposase
MITATAHHQPVRFNKVTNVLVAHAPRDLSIHMTMLWCRVKEASGDPAEAFPGHGHMKPDQLELIKVWRKVARLRTEPD